jgi:AP-3 complex subunit mu
MRILAPISGNGKSSSRSTASSRFSLFAVDPLYAFAFLQTFTEILQEYFGQLSAITLKDNFDVVYQVSFLALISFFDCCTDYFNCCSNNIQLLEETLDSIGYPNTTSPNALRDIVLPPSLLNKILTVAGASGLSNASIGTSTPFASPIPWRKAGLRYNNNEIYLDVGETLRAIVGRYVQMLFLNI